jgi:hypothetical protein
MVVNGKVCGRACLKAMQTGRDYSRKLNNNVTLAARSAKSQGFGEKPNETIFGEIFTVTNIRSIKLLRRENAHFLC